AYDVKEESEFAAIEDESVVNEEKLLPEELACDKCGKDCNGRHFVVTLDEQQNETEIIIIKTATEEEKTV
ncbi:MAG: hypothetical protein H0X29_05785, partial [Parachlamydiaceae bacterium]|nr:hypothetical protein [Parachlamydiaceae bacterium]